MTQKDLFLKPASAPHLKSEASFLLRFAREITGAGLLFLAVCFMEGADYLLSASVFFGTLFGGEILFRFLGFSPSPRWDFSLLNQGLLVMLFLPANFTLEGCLLAAFVLAAFYRLSGGRAGYVLQPACFTLAFLAGLGFAPAFKLTLLPLLPSFLLFGVWFAVQFPRTRVQAERMTAVLAAGLLVAALHEMSWVSALLWSAAAGEILFDRALAPLAARARIWFYGVIFTLFALLAASGMRSEALVISGMAAGFFAAWIERRSLPGETR